MKKISILIAAFMFLFILSACASTISPAFYTETVTITSVDDVEVFAVDSNGELWSWKHNGELEEWSIGRVVTIKLNNNSTSDNLYDDIIVDIY